MAVGFQLDSDLFAFNNITAVWQYLDCIQRRVAREAECMTDRSLAAVYITAVFREMCTVMLPIRDQNKIVNNGC